MAEYNRLKPLSELRHWSEYETVSEWYAAFHGYVPSALAVGLTQRGRDRGISFREAYAQMCVQEGRLVSAHEDGEPPCGVCDLLHAPAPQKSG